MEKWFFIHVVEYYSAIERNKILARTRTHPEFRVTGVWVYKSEGNDKGGG